MADVSGLLISALAISFEIASILYRYGKSVKGAGKDIQALSSELFGLIGVLEHVKLQNEQAFPEDEEKTEYSDLLPPLNDLRLSDRYVSASTVLTQEPLMAKATDVLQETLDFLQELRHSLGEPKGRFAVVVSLLKWPLKESDMKKHLKRLERVKSFFLLSLVTDGVDQSRKIYEEIFALRTMLDESSLAEENRKSNQEYSDVLSWLSPVDPNLRRRDLSKVRTQDTGTWFTESPEIRGWRNLESSSSKTLWLNGITGAGKSTLMTAVLDQLLSTDQNRRDVSFFYCSFSDEQSLHTENILGSLLAQTLLPSDLAYMEAKSIYDTLGKKSTGKSSRPELDALIGLLRIQAESSGRLFILIDGVNECSNPEELLSSVEEIATSTYPIRIFLSGIDENGISSRLSSFPGLIMQSLRPKSVKSDIFLHVQNTLSMQPRLRQLPQSLKDEIMHALTQGAQGMFRWVQCQLETLTKLRTPRAIRAALASMPLTLDKTYEALLLRIDEGEDAELSKQIFEMLAFSLRPLTLKEVTTFLQISPGMPELDESRLLTHPTDILSICGSFLNYNTKTGIVTLAHHSVKTFLTSDLPKSISGFHLDKNTAHRKLTLSCLTYLSFAAFADSESVPAPSRRPLYYSTYPLLGYAVEKWPLHLKELSSAIDLDTTLWNTLQDFLFRGNFNTWVKLLIPNSKHAVTTPPLYYASSFGLTTVVRYLLEMRGVNIEQRGGWGGATSINIASMRGNLDVVKLLYEKGADPRVPDLRVGLDAIQWAMYDHQHHVSRYFESMGIQFEEVDWIKDATMEVVDGKWTLIKPKA